MRATNANFDTPHALDYKSPMYLLHFDGEATDFCNHKPGSPDNSLKQYLVNIAGGSQRVTPEEGRSSIGGITVTVQDYNDEITALLATDTYYFHRKKTTIKAGYLGMDEADMLTVLTGWVTGLKMTKDLLGYSFSITDPIKWMQRKIFRGAEDSSVLLTGNPLNILLQVLTSTGGGSNGAYDLLDAADGLGIDDDFINVANFEQVRDDWFPGVYFSFTVTEREQAKQWIETEILKPCNLYPVIDADGKFNVKPFKPPIAQTAVQAFTEDNIIGLPKWDANLKDTVNEVEIYYEWDSGADQEFDTLTYYIDATSLNNRGCGKKPIVIKCKGLYAANGGVDFATRRKNKIFNRFATPPPKISFSAFFSRWLSEAGDIVPFTHSLVPDIEAGSRGMASERMEIVNRTIDWRNGKGKFELLATGFEKNVYCSISPTGTAVAGNSATEFTMSSADVAKFTEGWEVIVYRPNMVALSGAVTITDITGTTVTVDSMGGTPSAGYKVQFANYDDCTADQKQFWFLSDGGDQLGTANDDAHLIVP